MNVLYLILGGVLLILMLIGLAALIHYCDSGGKAGGFGGYYSCGRRGTGFCGNRRCHRCRAHELLRGAPPINRPIQSQFPIARTNSADIQLVATGSARHSPTRDAVTGATTTAAANNRIVTTSGSHAATVTTRTVSVNDNNSGASALRTAADVSEHASITSSNQTAFRPINAIRSSGNTNVVRDPSHIRASGTLPCHTYAYMPSASRYGRGDVATTTAENIEPRQLETTPSLSSLSHIPQFYMINETSTQDERSTSVRTNRSAADQIHRADTHDITCGSRGTASVVEDIIRPANSAESISSSHYAAETINFAEEFENWTESHPLVPPPTYRSLVYSDETNAAPSYESVVGSNVINRNIASTGDITTTRPQSNDDEDVFPPTYEEALQIIYAD